MHYLRTQDLPSHPTVHPNWNTGNSRAKMYKDVTDSYTFFETAYEAKRVRDDIDAMEVLKMTVMT